MIEVREYIDAKGRGHFSRWRLKLDWSARARIDQAILRLGEGNLSNVKPEGEGVSALRLDFGPGYRVYFGQDGSRLILLLAGGTKRRQRDDIELARELWAEYKAEKKETNRCR
ncbi:MAG: type II toxin-antitoxin system RelE/ParE family toxin [Terracidiphilus sp.]